ncbi:MAG: hypothetical protein R3F60_33195 [bacterium]
MSELSRFFSADATAAAEASLSAVAQGMVPSRILVLSYAGGHRARREGGAVHGGRLRAGRSPCPPSWPPGSASRWPRRDEPPADGCRPAGIRDVTTPRPLGLDYPLASVVVGSGSGPDMGFSLPARSGEVVVTPAPSWNNDSFAGARGRPARGGALPARGDAFMPTAEALVPHLKAARLLVLCSP